jgi:hypothetical protein
VKEVAGGLRSTRSESYWLETLFPACHYRRLMSATQRIEHPARVVLYARRISYVETGQATGYSASYIDQVLNGRVPVSPEFARRLSAFLDLPPEELFALEEDVEEPRPRSSAPRSTRRRVTRSPRRSSAS